MPTLATPPVPHRSHIAVLEYFCDEQARRRPALGHIFEALRSTITSLGELVSAPAWTTPTFEVIPTAPVKCKHGLRESWCATCAMLSRSGKSKQRSGRSRRFLTMVNRQVGVKDSAGCAHGDGLGKKTITRTVSASEDRSGYWQNKANAVVLTPIVYSGFSTSLLPVAVLLKPIEPGWGWVAPKFSPYNEAWDVLRKAALEERFSGFTNWCQGCFDYVEQEHDCKIWREKKQLVATKQAAKMLAEQQAAAKMQAARREARKQRRHAALIAQGLYSPEARDLEIIRAKKGTVEAETITKFDWDLSRRGNKYRIQ